MPRFPMMKYFTDAQLEAMAGEWRPEDWQELYDARGAGGHISVRNGIITIDWLYQRSFERSWKLHVHGPSLPDDRLHTQKFDLPCEKYMDLGWERRFDEK